MGNTQELTAAFRSMKLGIVSHKRLWRDPEGVKSTGGFPRQVSSFLPYFGRVQLVVPVEVLDSIRPGSALDTERLEIVPLPNLHSGRPGTGLEFLLKFPVFLVRLWKAYPECDIWQYRLPGYIGLTGLLVHKLRRGRPGFVWLGTDWAGRITAVRESRFRRMLASLANGILTLLLKDVTVFALGNLPDRFKTSRHVVFQTYSTVISDRDILSGHKVELHTPVRVLYVGRLAPEKGLNDLIEAVSRCAQENLRVSLTLVGEGAERERLENLAAACGIAELVSFRGYVPQGDSLWNCYHEADIFVLPSLSEAQGKVLIEAMASGMPIIATKVGGIPKVITHEQNGILVPAGSPEAIAGSIGRLIHQPHLRRRLASEALRSARAYTSERQTRALLEQLSTAMQAPGRRAR